MAFLISPDRLDMTKPKAFAIVESANRSAGGFTYVAANGETYEVIGSGLTYDLAGVPTGGTVTGIGKAAGAVFPIYNGEADAAAVFGNGAANFFEALLDGDDQIESGDDNDRFVGTRGNDTIKGAGGEDVLFWRPGQGVDTFDGGDDLDKADIVVRNGFSLTDGIDEEVLVGRLDANGDMVTGVSLFNVEVVELRAGSPGQQPARFHLESDAGISATFFGSRGDDIVDARNFDGIGEIHGGRGDDRLLGDRDTSTLITGGAGNDTLAGGSGGETIDGGAGNDVIRGMGGRDFLAGGGGNDTIIGGSDIDTVQGGNGADLIRTGGGNDFVFGDGGADTIDGQGGADILIGGAGRDSLRGGGGGDTLRGGDGNDVIAGGAGNDEISGDGGADTLRGGSGRDALSYSTQPEGTGGVIVNLARGVARGGHAEGDDFAGFEDVIGSNDADRIVGDAAVNRLTGGKGADTLTGAAGNDTLSGGAGNDDLRGGGGNDRIAGDAGNDVLAGGEGADVFVFGESQEGFGNDTIADYQLGIDTFEIEGLDSAEPPFVHFNNADGGALVIIDYATNTNGDDGTILVLGVTADQLETDLGF